MVFKKTSRHGGSMFGVILTILGTLWVLNNLDIIDFQFKNWWPLILIILGLMNIFGTYRFNNPGAWIMIALGVIFLLANHGYFTWSEIWKFWPVILIIIGVSLIFRRKIPRITVNNTNCEGKFSGNSIFSDVKKKINDTNFTGGSMNVIFSDTEFDLTTAQLHENGAVMVVNVIFADVDIRIPNWWPIEIHTSGVFGDIKNKTDNPIKTEGKRLVMQINAVFGDFDLKN